MFICYEENISNLVKVKEALLMQTVTICIKCYSVVAIVEQVLSICKQIYSRDGEMNQALTKQKELELQDQTKLWNCSVWTEPDDPNLKELRFCNIKK